MSRLDQMFRLQGKYTINSDNVDEILGLLRPELRKYMTKSLKNHTAHARNKIKMVYTYNQKKNYTCI